MVTLVAGGGAHRADCGKSGGLHDLAAHLTCAFVHLDGGGMSTPQKPSAQVHKSEPVGVGAETAGFEGQDEVSVYARATPEHKLRIASHI
jgi:hypothetical protein